jgi:hypothetical protein
MKRDRMDFSRSLPNKDKIPSSGVNGTKQPVSEEFSGHFGMHSELGPLIHDAERNNGNINIRVNRIIQSSPTAREGDH